jgi:membrane-associated phospholipid phosphatase
MLVEPQDSVRTDDRRTTSVPGLVVYATALTAYVVLFGLPKQPWLVVAWFWLALIAKDVRKPWREHVAFWRDWWIPVGLLVLYTYSRGLADQLGFAVHFREPIDFDRSLFGGTLPTESLQHQLCGDPCRRSMPPRWYDVGLTTVYYSHFFVTPVVAAWLWLRDRTVWIGYMRRYMSLCAVALTGYVLYPMAPPWMAAREGEIGHVARITGRGWYDLGHSGGATGQQRLSTVGNQVAAMPSLHTALALFAALFLISRLSSPYRWLLLLYPAAMSFLLVYYAEHYVLDVLAGYACVALVLGGWAWWERRSHRTPVAADAD